ncbi:DNA alkylation repair protein [Corynebacterium sp. HMSC06C06]|uniref:DNA alkylation repair protein n=1 Tax=Corynebacterium sp. HMSC06C06 TaxID=1581121 RepID=UPI00352F06AE
MISQLGKREATDLQLLADAIKENLPGTRFGNEFFISIAIGWALRDLYRTNPTWVLGFLGSHDVANLTRREALKHHR